MMWAVVAVKLWIAIGIACGLLVWLIRQEEFEKCTMVEQLYFILVISPIVGPFVLSMVFDEHDGGDDV